MASRVELRWNHHSRTEYVAKRVQEASEAALREAANEALRRADVPVRSGALKRSGRVDMVFPVAVVSFGLTGRSERGRETRYYAIPQHQRFDYKHPGEGSPLFLARSLSDSDHLFRVMANRIRRTVESE